MLWLGCGAGIHVPPGPAQGGQALHRARLIKSRADRASLGLGSLPSMSATAHGSPRPGVECGDRPAEAASPKWLQMARPAGRQSAAADIRIRGNGQPEVATHGFLPQAAAPVDPTGCAPPHRPCASPAPRVMESAREFLQRVTRSDAQQCPCCQDGRLRCVQRRRGGAGGLLPPAASSSRKGAACA